MNECAICFYNMDEKKDKLTRCNYCNKCIHTKCHKLWKKKTKDIGHDICVYCQCQGGLHPINLTKWESFVLCCFG